MCLWIFEELANYCALCQYMLPSLLIHTYMSNILIFFITGDSSNICTFEKHIYFIYCIDIITHANYPSFLIPAGSRVLNQPIHRVVLEKCNIVFVFLQNSIYKYVYNYYNSIVAFFFVVYVGLIWIKKKNGHSTSALCM